MQDGRPEHDSNDDDSDENDDSNGDCDDPKGGASRGPTGTVLITHRPVYIHLIVMALRCRYLVERFSFKTYFTTDAW